MVDEIAIGSLKTVYQRPKIKMLLNGKAELTEDYCYYIRSLQKTIWISNGFQFDGFSIPKYARWLIGNPFEQLATVPALIHDALYASELTSKSEADETFIDEMCKWKFAWWRRNLMYKAVSWFGWMAWDEHTELSIQKNQEYIRFVN